MLIAESTVCHPLSMLCQWRASEMAVPYFIFELVVLLHVLLVLALGNLSASLVHSAVLLKFRLLEHACAASRRR